MSVEYPVFLEDCAAEIVRWSLADATAYGADPSRLAVMGRCGQRL